ncbi:Hypothetical predicted protein [Mytilus galloprovincialis]|uniref:Endonuclease/exonuclease/phosphatase domain-containing protein n=1 Tax=Mytilus galloprovincialis TaxID=29158 RepID=A0A8B6EX73_MYTGA|nr:Hypothetical predicted protein [Mytilus galloprovincialis]
MSSYLHQSDDDVLDSIERDMTCTYKQLGDIILCGDLNARSGSEPDFIQNDVYDTHLPIYNDYDCDTIQDVRHSYDSKVDVRGRQLLDLCISTKMRILNGRVLGDLYGKFTCHKPTGSSVVDYVIVSEALLPKILSFKISDFIPNFSDCHCKLSFGILATYSSHLSINKFKMNAFPGGYKWTKSSTSQFQDALCHPVCKSLLNNFMNHEYDNEDSERAVPDFLNIINVAATKANIFRHKSSKKRKPNCKWFDSDLGVKRKILVSKGELLSKFPYDPIVRGSYYKCYREYNKLRKYKMRTFKQSILNSLDNLRDSDPKQYWKLINSLKESTDDSKGKSVEPEVWFNHFFRFE